MSRTVYRFKVPAGIDQTVTSFGMHELTMNEERMALEAAMGARSKALDMQVMHSLVEVNGSPVSVGDGSADKAYSNFSSKLRNLAIIAHQKIHVPTDKETEGFLASMEAAV